MVNYLKEHEITKDMHNAQKAEYIKSPYTNPNITWSRNAELLTAHLTLKEAMRHWFVKSR